MMMDVKKLINYFLILTFFLVPLTIWLKHFKPFVSMKDFVFISLMFISLALLIISFILEGKFGIKKSRIHIAVITYYLYNLISYLIFPYTDGHYFLILTSLVILFFVVSYVVDVEFRNRIVNTLFVVALISSVYGVFQFLGIDYGLFVNYFGSRLEYGSRLFTIFGNPNLLGGFSVFILPLIAAFFIKSIQNKKNKKALYLGIVFVLSFITLLLAQTRGSILAFFVSVVVFGLLYFRKNGVTFIKKHSIVTISVIIVLIIVGSLGFNYVKTNTNLMSANTIKLRLFYYGSTIDMIKDDVLFGKGIGTFNIYYPTYRDKRVSYQLGEREMEFRVEHPHNEHLEVLSDLGIVGYALFIWIIIEALWLLLRKKDIISIGISVAIIGVLVDGLMMQNLRFTVIASLLWLMIGFSTLNTEKNSYGKLFSKLNLSKGVFAIIIIIFVSFPIYSAYKTMHSDYFTKGGIGYYSQNSPDGATFWLGEAIDINPHNKRALYYIAPSYKSLDEPEKAIKYYSDLLELDPNFIQTNYQLGLIYLELKEVEKSKQYFEKQTDVNNMYWQAYYYLAFIESNEGDVNKALSYLDEVDKINSIKKISDEYYSKIQELRQQLEA